MSTNDLLHALLDDDPVMRAALLESLSRMTNRDLTRCTIRREAYEVDAATGKQSYRDFLLSDAAGDRCIIETKVDSGLTSSDQATRYLAQLPSDGALVLVTRGPLAPALAAQVEAQLQVPLTSTAGASIGRTGDRTVVVLSWTDLLRGVLDADGRPFDELIALDLALETITDFVPFDGSVERTSTGVLVQQVVDVADQVCSRLARRLVEAGVAVDDVSKVKRRVRCVYVNVSIAKHEFWLGYDVGYWAKNPGDPRDPASGRRVLPGSPLWIDRWRHEPHRSIAAAVHDRRNRLDALGITAPLPVALGVPRDAVVERVLGEAVARIGVVSTALHADPEAGGGPSVAEEPATDE